MGLALVVELSFPAAEMGSVSFQPMCTKKVAYGWGKEVAVLHRRLPEAGQGSELGRWEQARHEPQGVQASLLDTPFPASRPP